MGLHVATTVRTTAVGAMHAASASGLMCVRGALVRWMIRGCIYLDARAVGETALDPQQSAADLVLHGGFALLVVHDGLPGGVSSGAEDAAVRLAGGGAGGDDGVVLLAGTGAAAEDGAAGGSVGACEGHGVVFCVSGGLEFEVR